MNAFKKLITILLLTSTSVLTVSASPFADMTWDEFSMDSQLPVRMANFEEVADALENSQIVPGSASSHIDLPTAVHKFHEKVTSFCLTHIDHGGHITDADYQEALKVRHKLITLRLQFAKAFAPDMVEKAQKSFLAVMRVLNKEMVQDEAGNESDGYLGGTSVVNVSAEDLSAIWRMSLPDFILDELDAEDAQEAQDTLTAQAAERAAAALVEHAIAQAINDALQAAPAVGAGVVAPVARRPRPVVRDGADPSPSKRPRIGSGTFRPVVPAGSAAETPSSPDKPGEVVEVPKTYYALAAGVLASLGAGYVAYRQGWFTTIRNKLKELSRR